jgi:hypothetical protein
MKVAVQLSPLLTFGILRFEETGITGGSLGAVLCLAVVKTPQEKNLTLRRMT